VQYRDVASCVVGVPDVMYRRKRMQRITAMESTRVLKRKLFRAVTNLLKDCQSLEQIAGVLRWAQSVSLSIYIVREIGMSVRVWPGLFTGIYKKVLTLKLSPIHRLNTLNICSLQRARREGGKAPYRAFYKLTCGALQHRIYFSLDLLF
jgi:hypothetical protein